MADRLSGKVALITGASSSMGKAIITRFLEEGAWVVASGRCAERMAEWSGNPNVCIVVGDETDLETVMAMVAAAKETFGRLDCVCNMADFNDLGYPLLEVDDARWDEIIDTCLKAPFLIYREALPLLLEAGGSCIVNIDSFASLQGSYGPVYEVAMGGLEGITRSIASGYSKDHIRCNIIRLGGTMTDATVTSTSTVYPARGALSEPVRAIPANWMGQIGDIANVCIFLCTDESEHINGAVISVSGGMSVC